MDDARALHERLLGLSSDLGLLAEEYDVERKRQVGNFPQAFSHFALVNASRSLTLAERHPGVSPIDLAAEPVALGFLARQS